MSLFRQAREEQRKQAYKYTPDVGATSKKKREQIQHSIRKEKRTQELKKRRGKTDSDPVAPLVIPIHFPTLLNSSMLKFFVKD